MTGAEFAAYIRYRTRTNSTTLTDAEIILLGNVHLAELSKALMGADEDTLIMPMTTNLQADLREYPFPTSILSRIKYVEAKLDGTTFIHLNEFDLNQYQKTTDETTILSLFSNEEGRAAYDIERKALIIYSGAITDVISGLKLWCNVYPAPLDVSRIADLTTGLEVDPTTTSHGFPKELHKLWATSVIIDYKQSREKPIPLNEQELRYDVDLQEAIVALRHGNLDRVVIAQIPPASDRGNNGLNY